MAGLQSRLVGLKRTVTKQSQPPDPGKGPKTPQKRSGRPKSGVPGQAKPSFVVMHIDQRLSVSPPEPVNAEKALKIIQTRPRRGSRCANCVSHLFVDRTGGSWRVKFVDVERP